MLYTCLDFLTYSVTSRDEFQDILLHEVLVRSSQEIFLTSTPVGHFGFPSQS